MLCSECGKNEATFHSIKNINGTTIEEYLCPDCQRKRGGGLFQLGFGQLFGGLGDFFADTRPRRDSYVCPTCGTTGEEFMETGLVGCADCYAAFAPLIMPVIRRMQGDTKNIGRAPNETKSETDGEYARLYKELREAVAAEDYGKAANLQEQLEALRGGKHEER